MFEKLLKLKDDGTLNDLVETGLMSPKIYTYLEIYMWIDARMKATGKNISTVAAEAEVSFRVGRTTIWTAIRCIKNKQ
jgi:hypothetical protein